MVFILVMVAIAQHKSGIKTNMSTVIVLYIIGTLSAGLCTVVAGGSLLLIPLVCSLFGLPADISMQVVGVGFICGVIQDSCEPALNSSTDVLLTATAELHECRRMGEKKILSIK